MLHHLLRPIPCRVTRCVFSIQLNRAFAKKSAAKGAASGTSSGNGEDNDTMDEGKRSALNAALSQIEKSFGKGSVMKLGNASNTQGSKVEAISTGSLGLDMALGIGGLPRGRIVEVFGAEMSGKTTLALHCIAEVQKRGGHCTFIDAEHALDPIYAKTLGVNVDQLYIAQPDSGEQALEITDTLVRSGAMDLIVVDSVAALVPKAELEGEMGDAHMGLQARLMSQAMRKLTASVSRVGTILLFINQLRSKIGMFAFGGSTTSGGNALKFYASVRLELKPIAKIKKGQEIIGNQVRIKVVKNKLAPPLRQVDVDVEFGKGISRSAELVDLALLYGLVTKAGSHFKMGEISLGQGKESAKKYLIDNPEAAATLQNDIVTAAKEKDALLSSFDADEDGGNDEE